MWISFFATALAATFVLYLPGFLMLRSFFKSNILSLSAAPFVSTAFIVIVATGCTFIGIPCSSITVLSPVLIACVIVFAASAMINRRANSFPQHSVACSPAPENAKEWRTFALYVFVGLAAVFFIFVKNLDGADSFVQEYDGIHHLGVLTSFIESGKWSSFDCGLYLQEPSNESPFSVDPSFYPAAWHTIGALAASITGSPTTVVCNALNTVLTGIVFPSGMFLLMKAIFEHDDRVVFFGAFVCMAFAAFPWKFLYWGPVFPNLMSLCLLPPVVALFIALTSSGKKLSERVSLAAFLCLGAIALAFSQPNAVFSAGAFLIPYCIWRIYIFAKKRCELKGHRRHRALFIAIAASFAFLALWTVFYFLPPLQTVINHPWTPFTGASQAIANILFLSFRETPAQLLLGAFVALGVVSSILRKRTTAWTCASYALMAVIYIACAATDSPIRNFFSGFWYTDPMRIAANMAIFAIPIASVGLSCASAAIGNALLRLPDHASINRHSQSTAQTIAAVLLIAVVAAPNFSIPGKLDVYTGLGESSKRIESSYLTTSNNVYDHEEREFVELVKQTLPADSLVLNEPNDGSAFAYSVDGLNVFFRNANGYVGTNETDASIEIRHNLKNIENDPSVQEAVRSTGALYLLQLDQKTVQADRRYLFSYVESDWDGIDNVTDSTPGFEIVLSKGDMRLYRITALSQ